MNYFLYVQIYKYDAMWRSYGQKTISSTRISKHDLQILHTVRVTLAPERLLHYSRLPFLYLQHATFDSVGYLYI